MVTVTADQVVIDRADLAALLDLAALTRMPVVGPPPVRPELVNRCTEALDTPTPAPAWDLLAEPITRLADLEPRLAAHRAAHLDQVQARLRDGLAHRGVTITAPGALHTAIALLEYMRATAVHDQRAGRLNHTEGTVVRAIFVGLGAALVRWLPPEARP